MYVCVCKGVTDHQIRQQVSDGARSWQEVREATGCATQCGKCACFAKSVTREAVHEARLEANAGLAYAV
ncbi:MULTISPECIES: (2Fe-2S)-binding protein [Halomonadaceae]|jgi:bacterioferritin-associated ferredoxin|uniref:Bacterioferritin-associated ferredoxin n=1 Tax=Vreelandella janggokensis TaxID=370767 RepID=A0ABT4IRH3_9GAMM|nr:MULTISPECIES: (2Fe-2S)-binding protein [Halomonas]MCW4150107.1 (2Fe-2S)-binding protein [Halomonas sp. 18H]MCZ0926193.1 (2Fe-2S)-binding protein [Halomonas janggokensis]MCZ0931260.1 (2Fe-2S)-binding protein [Halomonas janggokensis]MDR5887707.1 (2Fe-2S)-binding protein [Halomonas janggokensis]QPL46754.1 (2Fe-2S)-binding protein [Halomonas sp. A40-4]